MPQTMSEGVPFEGMQLVAVPHSRCRQQSLELTNFLLLLQTMSGGVPIEGVQLGSLLGKGSFGRVYHCHWHGSEVAIKVCV